jgi:Ca2+-binding EF-hand superfamily protein
VYRKRNFAAVNTHEMFKAVDTDHNGKIYETEWLAFWAKVENTGHPEEEIIDEVRRQFRMLYNVFS